MTPRVQAAFGGELSEARQAEARGDDAEAWRHLERAHVLSQAHAFAHVLAHARMFEFALRRRDLRELSGQLARLILAAPGSWSGRAPLGNTGGANVGIFKPIPIPDDLRAILDG